MTDKKQIFSNLQDCVGKLSKDVKSQLSSGAAVNEVYRDCMKKYNPEAVKRHFRKEGLIEVPPTVETMLLENRALAVGFRKGLV